MQRVLNRLSRQGVRHAGDDLFDAGDDEFLYYYDVLGNVLWGRITKLEFGYLPNWLIIECTHRCLGAGATDAGDDVFVRQGLELTEHDGFAALLSAIRIGGVKMRRLGATGKLDDKGDSKIVRWSEVYG